MAGQKAAALFGRFFDEKRSVAVGAGFAHRSVPDGEGAVGIPVAAIKDFAAFGLLLDDVAGAPFLRTFYTRVFGHPVGIDRAGGFAVGVTAAGKEFTVSPLFDKHRFAALFTTDIRHAFFGDGLGSHDALFVAFVVAGELAILLAVACQVFSIF